MAKRYSESEKRQIVFSWLSSGRRCAAYARECGISALTLKSWHLQYVQPTEPSGFISITAPEVGDNYSFRIIIGAAVLEFDRLPHVDYVQELLQMRPR